MNQCLFVFFPYRAQTKLIALQKHKGQLVLCLLLCELQVECDGLTSATTVWCVACHACGSIIEALVPGLPCSPLPEVHADIGGHKIIHLVTLLEGDRDTKRMK